MTTEQLPIAELEHNPSSYLAQLDSDRHAKDVQSALVLAKRFPRDTVRAHAKIMQACKRYTLAQRATYAYPRGGETVSGPTIRLAEILAQNYGNMKFGISEVERLKDSTIAEAFAWDLENNVWETRRFEVKHEIKLKKGGTKYLTDPRDVYELVANYGARRMRACILAIVPMDFVEDAVAACRATLAGGQGSAPLIERVRRMVSAFSALGVSQEMIEERLGHKIDLTTGDEVVGLVEIHNAIAREGHARGDYFEFPKSESGQGGNAGKLAELLSNKQKENDDGDNEKAKGLSSNKVDGPAKTGSGRKNKSGSGLHAGDKPAQ